VAIVHDYLSQRGGAERVVLAMLRAFPGAEIFTSLYVADATYPEFRDATIHTSWLNLVPPIRRNHRLALPFLAATFSTLIVDADIAICSSSGWAHGVRTNGFKLVYCYTPARWLYEPDKYLELRNHRIAQWALRLLTPSLLGWDRRHALAANQYLTTSTAVQQRIRIAYGIEAEIVPPPYSLDTDGPIRPIQGVEPGFFLCVARLIEYKNLRAVIAASVGLPDGLQLVIVGDGPDRDHLSRIAPPNVHLVGSIGDAQLRWCYSNCVALVAAGYEDFGLTPLEAAAFGKPAIVLRWGGYLDTVIEGSTGIFFDTPTADAIRAAMLRSVSIGFSRDEILRRAASYTEGAFIDNLRRRVVDAANTGIPKTRARPS
jgi:glycosyltransferase involved in cell wall biosynthesis